MHSDASMCPQFSAVLECTAEAGVPVPQRSCPQEVISALHLVGDCLQLSAFLELLHSHRKSSSI